MNRRQFLQITGIGLGTLMVSPAIASPLPIDRPEIVIELGYLASATGIDVQYYIYNRLTDVNTGKPVCVVNNIVIRETGQYNVVTDNAIKINDNVYDSFTNRPLSTYFKKWDVIELTDTYQDFMMSKVTNKYGDL